MSKRITSLDVLGEVRRAQRILRRVVRYLEQQERAEIRRGEKRIALTTAGDRALAAVDAEVRARRDELGLDDQP